MDAKTMERLEEIKAIRERADWPTYPWSYNGARDDLMVLLWHMDEQARRIERLERVLAAERGEWALDGIDLLSVPCDRCAAAAGDRCHSPPNRYGTVDNYSLKNTHKVRKLKALKAAEAALRGDS